MIADLWFLAVVLGLIVSAGLHLVLVWPAQEPEGESIDEPASKPTSTADGEPADGPRPKQKTKRTKSRQR